jgi:cellobiose-specific phosphotransferase system component IIC
MRRLTRFVRARTLFIITALLAFSVGLAYMVLPKLVLSLYGITPADKWGVLALQAYGSLVLFYGLVTWFVRNTPESEARRAIIKALFVGFIITILTPLMVILSGVGNAVFWIVLFGHIVLAGAWGYIYFADRAENKEMVPNKESVPATD